MIVRSFFLGLLGIYIECCCADFCIPMDFVLKKMSIYKEFDLIRHVYKILPHTGGEQTSRHASPPMLSPSHLVYTFNMLLSINNLFTHPLFTLGHNHRLSSAIERTPKDTNLFPDAPLKRILSNGRKNIS